MGFWSESWARRQLSWHDHIMRSEGVMKELLLWRNSDWLQAQRSHFVASNGSASSRNSLLAGRTGTRLHGGKPQLRWDAGVALARYFLESRSLSVVNDNALSVSSRIRQAVFRFTVCLIINGQDPGS